ncbi:MAG: peptidoglycan DD-metalloendopeptidase family protein [Spirochaetota bacterium]
MEHQHIERRSRRKRRPRVVGVSSLLAVRDRGGGFAEALQERSRRGQKPGRRQRSADVPRSPAISLEHQRVARSHNRRNGDGKGGDRNIFARRGFAGRGQVIRRDGRGKRKPNSEEGLNWFSFAGLANLQVIPNTLGAAVSRLVDEESHLGNVPILVAAFCAVFVLNGVFGPDTAITRYVLPAQQSTIPVSESSRLLLDSLAPEEDYQVIGESMSVDPERFTRLEVQEYTLVPGDTLSGIATRFGLRMDTLVSFNQIQDVRRLQVGTTFKIPNRDGLLHEVQRGDSLSGIATEYGTSVNAILDANDMATSTIAGGDVLFVPNARMSTTELKLILGELFVYPVRGRFTSGFGMRNDPFTGLRRFHNGIDLAEVIGTPIGAAMAGTVAHTETQSGNYGKFVIVRHDGGFQTLYAHLDSFAVRKGQYVSQGQTIGAMGNTGRSTGPHLHFSIIRNGSFVDPLEYLH